MNVLQRLIIGGAVVAMIVGVGCRPRPTGDGPYAEKVANDIPQIERAMGVKFKHPPKLEVRSRQEVREFLLQKLDEPEVQKAEPQGRRERRPARQLLAGEARDQHQQWHRKRQAQ